MERTCPIEHELRLINALRKDLEPGRRPFPATNPANPDPARPPEAGSMEPDMRTLTALALSCLSLMAAGCAGTGSGPDQAPQATSNDCAVILAIAREHYRFGPDNLPPPLKAGGEDQWKPSCNTDSLGFTFRPYTDPAPGSDPRMTLKWVAFQKPVYDGQGALVQTEIMHGPLAGIGYECRLHSGIAGWTVGECKTGWVS
jgi:hypothetical protein